MGGATEEHVEVPWRPRVLPPGWDELETPPDARGVQAWFRRVDGLAVITSQRIEDDGKHWAHVSCSRADRLPDWNDLRAVKRAFLGRDTKAIVVLPPSDEYVNLHPYAMHLFHCLDGDGLPDFRKPGGGL